MKKIVGLVWTALLWALIVVASQGYALEGSWQLINNRDIKLDPSIDIEFQFMRSIGPNQTIVRSLVVHACYDLNYTYRVAQNSLSMSFQGILGIPRRCMGSEISTIRSKIDTVFYFVINGTTLSLFDPTGFAPFVFTNNDAAVGAAINGGWQTLTVNQEGQYQNMYLNGSHAFLCNGSGMAVYNVTSRSQIIFTIVRSLGCTRDQIAVLSALDSTIFYRVLNGNYLYLYDYRLNNILYAYYTSFVGYQQDLRAFVNNLNAPPPTNGSKSANRSATGQNSTAGNSSSTTPNQAKSNADQNGQKGPSQANPAQDKNSHTNSLSPFSTPSQTAIPAPQSDAPQKPTTRNPTTAQEKSSQTPPSLTDTPPPPRPIPSSAPPSTPASNPSSAPQPSTPVPVPSSTPVSSTPVSVLPSPPSVPTYSAPASNVPVASNGPVAPPQSPSSIPAMPPASSASPSNILPVLSSTNASGTTNNTQLSSNSTTNSSNSTNTSSTSSTSNSPSSSSSTPNSSNTSNSTSSTPSPTPQPVTTTPTTPTPVPPFSPAAPKALSSIAELVSVSSRLLDGKWYISSIGSQGGASFKGYYFIVNSSARRFIMYGGCNVQFYIYTLNNAQISFGTPTGTTRVCTPNNDPSVTEPIFKNAVYLQATTTSMIFYDGQLGVAAVLVNSSPS